MKLTNSQIEALQAKFAVDTIEDTITVLLRHDSATHSYIMSSAIVSEDSETITLANALFSRALDADDEMLDAEYIGLCIEELEIGDCSIMSALHNALAESV